MAQLVPPGVYYISNGPRGKRSRFQLGNHAQVKEYVYKTYKNVTFTSKPSKADYVLLPHGVEQPSASFRRKYPNIKAISLGHYSMSRAYASAWPASLQPLEQYSSEINSVSMHQLATASPNILTEFDKFRAAWNEMSESLRYQHYDPLTVLVNLNRLKTVTDELTTELDISAPPVRASTEIQLWNLGNALSTGQLNQDSISKILSIAKVDIPTVIAQYTEQLLKVRDIPFQIDTYNGILQLTPRQAIGFMLNMLCDAHKQTGPFDQQHMETSTRVSRESNIAALMADLHNSMLYMSILNKAPRFNANTVTWEANFCDWIAKAMLDLQNDDVGQFVLNNMTLRTVNDELVPYWQSFFGKNTKVLEPYKNITTCAVPETRSILEVFKPGDKKIQVEIYVIVVFMLMYMRSDQFNRENLSIFGDTWIAHVMRGLFEGVSTGCLVVKRMLGFLAAVAVSEPVVSMAAAVAEGAGYWNARAVGAVINAATTPPSSTPTPTATTSTATATPSTSTNFSRGIMGVFP